MRHLTRVHGVCIGFMHEQFLDTSMAMSYIPTAQMAADIYTKEFADGEKWNTLCRQIGLYTNKALVSGDLLSLFICQHDLRSDKRGNMPYTRLPRSPLHCPKNFVVYAQR